MASLLEYLSRSLGARQAAIEIKWMRQAAHAPHDLHLMVHRRACGEPLQYILGTQPFGPLNLHVRAPTLIPRPETEQWTSDLADRIHSRLISHGQRLKVIDLCTGSGCIPLLLCHLLNIKGVQVAALGVDISYSACQLARDNLASTSLSVDSFLDIQQKNLFDDDFWQFVEQAFRGPKMHYVVTGSETLDLDVLTANPPYITRDQWELLPVEVRDWEDPIALLGDPLSHSGGEDTQFNNQGLAFYTRIRDLVSLPGILSPRSVLAMEVGDGQAGDVLKIFGHKFGTPEVWRDWWGRERAVFIYGDDSPQHAKWAA